MVGAVAAVVVPVSGLLWALLTREVRVQVLTLKLSVTKRFGDVESRLAKLESKHDPEPVRMIRKAIG